MNLARSAPNVTNLRYTLRKDARHAQTAGIATVGRHINFRNTSRDAEPLNAQSIFRVPVDVEVVTRDEVPEPVMEGYAWIVADAGFGFPSELYFQQDGVCLKLTWCTRNLSPRAEVDPNIEYLHIAREPRKHR